MQLLLKRAVSPSDLKQAKEIYHDAFGTQAYWPFGAPVRGMLLCWADEKPIAFLHIRVPSLVVLAVKQSHQGKGIGSFLSKTARDLGASSVRVRESNTAARHIYTKHGFTQFLTSF